jgi:asparagine synthase (glutamine-hydrolysing)
MCGIAGIYRVEGSGARGAFEAAVRGMAGLMARRGPDAQGYWSDLGGHLDLGFRRLAVLDPRAEANQPMVSHDGRSVLVFNGEIYNFREIREELRRRHVPFRTTGDSEVLLEALNLWGEDAIGRLNGMFALAWYNIRERTLLLARDHAGIKPLYYFVHPRGGGVAFASQFDALLHTPWGPPGELRLDVVHLYLRLHHIPPPYGLLENTFQLEPGRYLVVKPDGRVQKKAWWTLPRDPEPDLSGAEAREALAEALEHAVCRHRVADVPLGVFLSGGVDSPLVTAVARMQTDRGLKAFTIGNPGWWQDESEAAAAYARHLDVDHHLHSIDGDEAVGAVEDVLSAQYEPFADFSLLPTLLVSRLARREITVSLSGDGGDELFFGYERPRSLLRNGGDFRWPWLVRAALYGAGRYGLGTPRSSAIVAGSPGDYYFDVNTRLKEHELARLAPGLPGLPEDFNLYAFDRYRGKRDLANFSRWVEFYGQLQRGLKKVDMASMHESLEVRTPLLDREVVDVSLRIDPFDSLRNGDRKAVLRESLLQHVPAELVSRSKLGFAVPLGKWLRGPLREWAEETLVDASWPTEGVLDQEAVQSYWQQHLSGRRDLKWGLWTILSLVTWLKQHERMKTMPQKSSNFANAFTVIQ